VSAVEQPDQVLAIQHGVHIAFILISVTTSILTRIADLIDTGTLLPRVGEVLPLSDAGLAHEMLARRAHRSGKIVLVPR
jgi:NADPH:quinone reductase-like Zn-dependent oxidoreductase